MAWCNLKKKQTKIMKITRSKFKPGGESVRPPFDEWNLKDDLMKMDGADENFLSLFEWHYTEKRILDGKTATKIVHNCQYSTPPLIWRIERKGHSRCEEVFPQVTTFFFQPRLRSSLTFGVRLRVSSSDGVIREIRKRNLYHFICK